MGTIKNKMIATELQLKKVRSLPLVDDTRVMRPPRTTRHFDAIPNEYIHEGGDVGAHGMRPDASDDADALADE